MGVGGFAMCVAVGEVALLAAVELLVPPPFLSVGSVDRRLLLPVIEADEADEADEEEPEAALLTSSTVALVSSVTARITETMRAGSECAADRQSKRACSRIHPTHRCQRFILHLPFRSGQSCLLRFRSRYGHHHPLWNAGTAMATLLMSTLGMGDYECECIAPVWLSS
jgi:hypothetical protein